MKHVTHIQLVIAVISASTPLVAAQNLVINGDFQTGSIAPSTTGYAEQQSVTNAGTWRLSTFDTGHDLFDDFFDHTFGDANGFYMVINGSDNGSGPAWSQAVAVQQGQAYQIEAWCANAYPLSVASLEFRVNGTRVGEPFIAGDLGVTGVWQHRHAVYSAASTGEVTLELWAPTG